MKPSRLSSASAAVLLAGMALLGCGRTHASPPDPAHDAGAASADSHSPEPGSIVVVDPQMLAALTGIQLQNTGSIREGEGGKTLGKPLAQRYPGLSERSTPCRPDTPGTRSAWMERSAGR